MKSNFTAIKKYTFLLLSIAVLFACNTSNSNSYEDKEEHEEYDGPAEIAALEFRKTKDPSTGKVPRERLLEAMQETERIKADLPFQVVAGYGSWQERGPNSDTVGAFNGNTRANSGRTSGRVRAVLIDAADVTGNTVWVGGVNGGLWKTTNINSSPATWTLVNDFFANMAVSYICQNPASTSTMYFCTGESYYNGDAVDGDGVFKSTDGGATWTQLSSTTVPDFTNCTRILCDASGNVYVSTRTGIYRSTNGGTTWVTITPTGLATSSFSDMEISSTGRLHVSAGIFSTCAYRFTSSPSTVTSATWTSPTSGYPSSSVRIELACNGNNLLALPSDASYEVPTIYKSTDGGATWAATTGQPGGGGWANGQAWYNLAADIDPSNPTTGYIVGGLEPYRTTDGGATWTRIGRWVGTTGQYVHADIHFIDWTSSNRVIFGCDGGIHFSTDGGTTIRDRNVGLRLKQFYSCAVHPTTTDYFLAGAQDNGSHRFRTAGLAGTTEVMGGDGAFVHIDQNQPQYQFVSYLFNDYFRSADGGTSWTEVDLGPDGQFINPTDYDNAGNVMYCGDVNGAYRRWTDPQTGATSASVSIAALGGNPVTAITVSPYTSNRVYFGTENIAGNTKVCYVNNASTTATGSAGVDISTGLPTAGYVSCIDVGTNDNNLMVCYSNYGVNSIWVSSNGGTSWTSIEGNLPDMPIRWCMFYPGDNSRAIIATETGVWLTLAVNGGSTNWIPSPTFPTVRTDMLQFRSSTLLVAAATHGRGLWTQPAYSIVSNSKFSLSGKWQANNGVKLNWEAPAELNANTIFNIEESTNGAVFNKIYNTIKNSNNFYTYNYNPAGAAYYYRVKSVEPDGNIRYSNTIKLVKNASSSADEMINVYPNPVASQLNIDFDVKEKGNTKFTLTNVSGNVVWQTQQNFSSTGIVKRNWDIGHLPKGNYVLAIINNNQRRVKKVIKL